MYPIIYLITLVQAESSRGVLWVKQLYVHKFYGIVRRCILYKINHANKSLSQCV